MKRICIAMATVLTAFGCQAVTLPFNTTAPPAWTKVAESTSQDGVNIRKASSTSAPKLVYNANNIEACDADVWYFAYWSAKSGYPIEAAKFNGPSPVVSEQPGWIQILNLGPKHQSNAWVSSKYCKVSEVSAIKPVVSPRSCSFRFLDTPADTEGTYGMYMYTDDMNGLVDFYIGRLVEGKMVCPYSFDCNYMFDLSDEGPVTLTKDSDGYTLKMSKQGHDLVDFGYGDTYVSDINKIPADIINMMVRLATPLEGSPAIIYDYNGDYMLLND